MIIIVSLFSYIEHNDKKYLHTYIVDIIFQTYLQP